MEKGKEIVQPVAKVKPAIRNEDLRTNSENNLNLEVWPYRQVLGTGVKACVKTPNNPNDGDHRCLKGASYGCASKNILCHLEERHGPVCSVKQIFFSYRREGSNKLTVCHLKSA